jgi:hypothetical protein
VPDDSQISGRNALDRREPKGAVLSPSASMSKDRRGTCGRRVTPHLPGRCMTGFCALQVGVLCISARRAAIRTRIASVFASAVCDSSTSAISSAAVRSALQIGRHVACDHFARPVPSAQAVSPSRSWRHLPRQDARAVFKAAAHLIAWYMACNRPCSRQKPLTTRP